MNRFSELKNLVTSLEEDFGKFYDHKNQSAGTRIRGGMQTLKTLAQEIRTEIQEIKNTKEAWIPKEVLEAEATGYGSW